MYLFLALDLEKTERHLEDDERIREVVMSLETVKEKLAKQEFEDSKTIIGLREALAIWSGIDTRRVCGRGRMGESTRQVEGLFESLLAEAFS
ncbi:hypothetical protein [Candidatus Villigracilis affinis]|uniref:hypothetical protein n=1 Tax=Candidatus Villigracilis affinis TaxID=3140682 RepID=UPI002A22EA75|nr:hypothetical protein [Anaerolineales bacterium]